MVAVLHGPVLFTDRWKTVTCKTIGYLGITFYNFMKYPFKCHTSTTAQLHFGNWICLVNKILLTMCLGLMNQSSLPFELFVTPTILRQTIPENN